MHVSLTDIAVVHTAQHKAHVPLTEDQRHGVPALAFSVLSTLMFAKQILRPNLDSYTCWVKDNSAHN